MLKLNEVVILIIDCPLTFKAPAKMHIKVLSSNFLFCIYLLSLLTDVSIEGNSVDPDQTASTGAV